MAKHLSDYASSEWRHYLGMSEPKLVGKCKVDVFRGSGKGGQKRNKTSNAIRLTLSYLSVTASKSRSKTENQTIAYKKMRIAIALDAKNLADRRFNHVRFLEDCRNYIDHHVIRINPKNPSFPIFIGHLVDLFIYKKGDLSKVAEECEVTLSQLNRFTGKHGFLKEEFKRLKERMDSEASVVSTVD